MALTAEVITRAKTLLSSLFAVNFEPLSANEKRVRLLEIYDEVTDNLGRLPVDIQALYEEILPKYITGLRNGNNLYVDYVREKLVDMLTVVAESEPAPEIAPVPAPPQGGKRSAISKKFDKCVKSVRRTVKARKGSTKESAAIAICATSVLYPRKRTIKRYRKGRLVTQRRKAL